MHSKLSAVLAEADFTLIEGDSTRTVPANHECLTGATVIYIDGCCHDYDIVVQDWHNVRALINANPVTIVAFDDMLLSEVARLKTEIEQARDLYCVFSINTNQFVVTSRNLPWINCWTGRARNTGVHQEPGEGGHAPGSNEPVALTRHLQVAPEPGAASATPNCRFERLTS